MQIRIALSVLVLLAACNQAPERDSPAKTSAAAKPAAAPSSSPSSPPASPSPPAATPAAASRYTSLKQCKVTNSAADEDWSESRCAGVGGLALQLDYGDLRENVQVLRAGQPPLDLALGSRSGGAFNAVGDPVEWRGRGPGNAPAALILRNNVSENVDQPERLTGYLVVTDLTQGCVVANLRPAADQNAAARAIADGPRRACLKE